MLLGFCVPFLVILLDQYCMLEESPIECEIRDIFICVRGMRGRNLVGRNHIGTELLMSASQPLRKSSILEDQQAIRSFHCVVCAVWTTIPTKTQRFIGAVRGSLGLRIKLLYFDLCFVSFLTKETPEFLWETF